MRTEEFHSLLSQDDYSGVDIHEMKSLLDRHPYSHTVRLAYLKCLHVVGDDRLGHALDEAAIHLPDRKVLYSFITNLQERKESDSELGLSEEELESSSSAELDSEKLHTTRMLQRQYLTEAVQSSILLEVGDTQEDQTNKDGIDQEAEASPPKSTPPTSFLEFVAGESGIRDLVKDTSGSEELIARFLSNDKREKTEFFDPEKMAKKSLDDSEGLVSDTLARIYINQGNLNKALEAYNQLILKYPEKSGYFAARIQKVEELKRKK